MKLEYYQELNKELVASVEFYEEKTTTVGLDFLEEIEKSMLESTSKSQIFRLSPVQIV